MLLLLYNHFFFHQFSVFLESSFHAIHFSFGTNPEFITNGANESFVVTDEDNSALEKYWEKKSKYRYYILVLKDMYIVVIFFFFYK